MQTTKEHIKEQKVIKTDGKSKHYYDSPLVYLINNKFVIGSSSSDDLPIFFIGKK